MKKIKLKMVTIEEIRQKFNEKYNQLSFKDKQLIEKLLEHYKNLNWSENKILKYIIDLIDSDTLTIINMWYI